MICSLCPTIRLSDRRAPGHGWQCPCYAVHCAHMLRCLDCHRSRYALERDGLLRDGRPTEYEHRIVQHPA